MHTKPVALVTGGNKGIGLEIVKGLTAQGYTVVLGSRDLAAGEKAAESVGADVLAVQLDVTDRGSIDAAAEKIRGEFGRLDVLINNAGIKYVPRPGVAFEEINAATAPGIAPLDDVRAIFETNLFGVISVTQAMLPLLREAPAGRIVNVSSRQGSLTHQSNMSTPVHGVAYAPSKSALNMITLAFAKELKDTRIKVNSACPGYTSTALTGFHATRTAKEGAREPVRLALIGEDGPTGTYSNEHGQLGW